jgi:hypothetical protein
MLLAYLASAQRKPASVRRSRGRATSSHGTGSGGQRRPDRGLNEGEFNYFSVIFTEERGRVVLLSPAEFSDIQLQSYYLVQCLKAKYV